MFGALAWVSLLLIRICPYRSLLMHADPTRGQTPEKNPHFPVRLSGQDCERGTFNQRHSVLYDQSTARRCVNLPIGLSFYVGKAGLKRRNLCKVEHYSCCSCFADTFRWIISALGDKLSLLCVIRIYLRRPSWGSSMDSVWRTRTLSSFGRLRHRSYSSTLMVKGWKWERMKLVIFAFWVVNMNLN